MKLDRRNAVSSWSGYNHQGKVGIFLAIRELKKLIMSEEDYSKYKLIFEKMEEKTLIFATLQLSYQGIRSKRKRTGNIRMIMLMLER